MARVYELIPGDRVKVVSMSGTFIASCDHPLFDGFMLVIWRMEDGTWSHDALLATQEVGEVVPNEDRVANLQQALLRRV